MWYIMPHDDIVILFKIHGIYKTFVVIYGNNLHMCTANAPVKDRSNILLQDFIINAISVEAQKQ